MVLECFPYYTLFLMCLLDSLGGKGIDTLILLFVQVCPGSQYLDGDSPKTLGCGAGHPHRSSAQ